MTEQISGVAGCVCCENIHPMNVITEAPAISEHRPARRLSLFLCSIVAFTATAADPPAPSTREMERINWMEFREWIPGKINTVLLPLGTIEPHGVTANGADILAPVAIAKEIAPRVNAMIAPVIPYGFTGVMDAYPGAFTVPEDVYRAYVRAILVGLAKNKFKNIILINGRRRTDRDPDRAGAGGRTRDRLANPRDKLVVLLHGRDVGSFRRRRRTRRGKRECLHHGDRSVTGSSRAL
jgi:hypothetical protein